MTSVAGQPQAEQENIMEEIIYDDVEVTPRERYISELKQLVLLLEENPLIPIPLNFGRSKWDSVTWVARTPVEAAAIVRMFPGRWGKNNPKESEVDAENLIMKKLLDRELSLMVIVSREGVCEKKVVGTEKKKVTKVTVKQQTEEVYEDVDMIEFECKSLLSVADQQVMDQLEAATV
jgi:hypothetical protein